MGHEIRVFSDQDGVFADFIKGLELIGTSVDSREKMWCAINQTPYFFRNLPEMAKAREYFDLIKAYDPIVLTGVIDGMGVQVRYEKTEWMKEHFNLDKVIVTDKDRKTDFMYPGDILFDDNEGNINKWNEMGGIGIFYDGHDIDALKKKMNDVGLVDGKFSDELLKRVETLRQQKHFKRNGYSYYNITRGTKSNIFDKYNSLFPSYSENGTAYNLVCDHVTRQFPVGHDITFSTFPTIEIVGLLENDEMGVQTLICTVDGELERPGGGYYHITYALDNSEDAVLERQKKPVASDSNILIQQVVDTKGLQGLFNLDNKNKMSFTSEYFLHRAPQAVKKPVPEKPVKNVRRYPEVFSDGIEGFREETKVKDSVTTKYYYEKDGENVMHHPDMAAIQKIDGDKKVLEIHMQHGKKISYKRLTP